MIKDNQKELNNVYVILDAVLIALAYFIAWALMKLGDSTAITLSPQFYFSMLIIIIPVYLILNAFNGMYDSKQIIGRRKELINICISNVIGLLIFTLVFYLGSKNPYLYNFSRRLIIYFHILVVVFEILERYAIRFILRNITQSGLNNKEILLVGYSRAAEGFIDRLLRNPGWGYDIRGILDDHCELGYEYKGIAVVGTVKDLSKTLESAKDLDEIAITLSLNDYDYLEDIVNECEKSGVHTKFIPDYNDIIPTIPQIEDVQGLPVINIRRLPLAEAKHSAPKRLVDILGSAFCIILFSPIMLITIIAIKLTSKGPIFYAQERVGKHGKVFKMYKFRSMKVQDEDEEKTEWTTQDDPRVTGIGKIIRKTSIDEMPQFWNILKGDMSLIGPRPERPFFVEKFRDEIPHYMIKHQVRPGLTGWAQVNGLRGDTSIQERIKYDLYYIENWTFSFDIKILFLTVFKGFINKNAY